MSNNDTMRDVRHVKAARELLRWDQKKLADAAALSLVTVRRYEAARGPIAEEIERKIVTALENAGVVFVPCGEIDDTSVAGGVLLRREARPEPQSEKRVYVYVDKSPGRPAGTREGSTRKARAKIAAPAARRES